MLNDIVLIVITLGLLACFPLVDYLTRNKDKK